MRKKTIGFIDLAVFAILLLMLVQFNIAHANSINGLATSTSTANNNATRVTASGQGAKTTCKYTDGSVDVIQDSQGNIYVQSTDSRAYCTISNSHIVLTNY